MRHTAMAAAVLGFCLGVLLQEFPKDALRAQVTASQVQEAEK